MFLSFQGIHWLKKLHVRTKEDSTVLMWAEEQVSVKFLLYISNITEVTAIFRLTSFTVQCVYLYHIEAKIVP
jgi:hypothetical protein